MTLQQQFDGISRTAPRKMAEVEDDGAGLDIRGLIRFFLRRLWIMVGVGAVVGGLFVVATMLQTPKFTGTALIMITPERGDIVTDGPAPADVNPDTGTIESQLEILQSRKLAGQLVDRLNLVRDPAWNPQSAPGLLQTISKLFGAQQSAAPSAEDLHVAREFIVDAVQGSVKARRRGLTYVIEVSATSPKPTQSAQMANTLVALYFESQLRARYEASQKANTWLSGRLTSLKSEVQQKEAAVEEYRAQTGLLTAQGASLTEQQITGLQSSILQARTDVAERQARYQQVRQIIQQGGSADSIAAVINSETIRLLRAQEADAARRQADLESRYGDLHPAIANARQERAGIESQIQAEVKRIAANLKNEVEVGQARLATLEGNEQSVQGQMVENNSGMVKLRELERDAAATRAIYESFLKRYQEISESVSLEVTDAHLVGEASVPTRKSSPRLSLALMLGIVLGGVMGLGAGLIVEFLDEGLDDAKSVATETGKPVLAAIPMVRDPGNNLAGSRTLTDEAVQMGSFRDLIHLVKRVGGAMQRTTGLQLGRAPAKTPPVPAITDARSEIWNPAAYLVEKPMSAFAEGFRSLRTSLLYSGLDRRVKTVAMTSAMPGEGKTTSSVCLARVAGLSGQRVVVVDCDLRRRSLSAMMGDQSDVGLLQVLRGEASWKTAVVKDYPSGIDVLPCTEGSFTPWDVFGSNAMKSLLQELSGAYDLIILDCPPVLAVAETRIICSLVDLTVLVVRWAHTPARAAYSAIEQIEQCGGLVGGVAINRVDPYAPGRGAYGDVTYQARYAGEYYQS